VTANTNVRPYYDWPSMNGAPVTLFCDAAARGKFGQNLTPTSPTLATAILY